MDVKHDGIATPIGYTIFVSPVKWVIILAPLAMVFADVGLVVRYADHQPRALWAAWMSAWDERWKTH
jgi:hypothetical protein